MADRAREGNGFERASVASEAGDYAEAKRLLEAHLAAHPDDVDAGVLLFDVNLMLKGAPGDDSTHDAGSEGARGGDFGELRVDDRAQRARRRQGPPDGVPPLPPIGIMLVAGYGLVEAFLLGLAGFALLLLGGVIAAISALILLPAAGVALVASVGLWRLRPWARWAFMAVVTISTWVPLAELTSGASFSAVATLLANGAVLVYLAKVGPAFRAAAASDAPSRAGAHRGPQG